MSSTSAQKLKIKEGYSLLTINAPAEFKNELDGLPEGVTVSSNVKSYNQVHWFVKNKAQLDQEVEHVIGLLAEGITLWAYFPKGSSKMQTDLTRDRGWEGLHKIEGLQWLNLISFNKTWSAFSMQRQKASDQKKAAVAKERPISKYINGDKKTVFLPDDFDAALQKAPDEKMFFKSLSFTNKKEYVEWIVSAKREETRASRVNESIERLRLKWKNPANR